MRGGSTSSPQAGQKALEKAIQGYRNTLLLDPEHYPARNNLAVAYLDQGEVGTAITLLERTVSAADDYEIAYKNLCIAYCRKFQDLKKGGDGANAAQFARRAVETWERYKKIREQDPSEVDRQIEQAVSKVKALM